MGELPRRLTDRRRLSGLKIQMQPRSVPGAGGRNRVSRAYGQDVGSGPSSVHPSEALGETRVLASTSVAPGPSSTFRASRSHFQPLPTGLDLPPPLVRSLTCAEGCLSRRD